MADEEKNEQEDKEQRDRIKALIREALSEHETEKEAARKAKENDATKETHGTRTKRDAWFGLG